MPIPIRAVGTVCSTTNLIGPLMELIRSEVQKIKDDFTTDPTEASYRNEPANVGFGLNIKLDSRHEEGTSGYASDMNVRLDLLNLSVDENSDEPLFPTPAVHLTTDLRIYDHLGEQTWLHGGPLEANRLRSIETKLHWNRNGWSAGLTLNDAAHNGVVDWGSEVPAQQILEDGQGSNYCLPECLSECLAQNSSNWVQLKMKHKHFSLLWRRLEFHSLI